MKFETLITETINPNTVNLDKCSTLEIVETINREDQKIAEAVAAVSHDIAKAIDLITQKLKNGGRMIYVGAGASGGQGVLDASECRATYGVHTETVQAAIVGGDKALWDSMLGDEDDYENGKEEMIDRAVSDKDVVVGIAASGRTPYVLGAIEQANLLGATTIGICNNPNTKLSELVNLCICTITGPEPIQGSTRMKSATAQKMVLNILSTGTMVKLGKVYGNLMVDLNPINEKLIDRAKRIVMQATGADADVTKNALDECDNNCKKAIVCILRSCNLKQAEDWLKENDGFIR